MDLLFATKIRVNRRLATGADRVKAKVLLDTSDTCHHYADLRIALTGIATLVAIFDRRWTILKRGPASGHLDDRRSLMNGAESCCRTHARRRKGWLRSTAKNQPLVLSRPQSNHATRISSGQSMTHST